MGCMFACMYAAWFDWFCYLKPWLRKMSGRRFVQIKYVFWMRNKLVNAEIVR